jgi:putative tryptophan/tyrosine transport system substrate-binding protein
MKRREFITLIAGATLVPPFGVNAQTPKQVKRLGILMNGVEANQTAQSYLATFTGKLGELGWEDGKNLHIEYRWNAGEPALARAYATELIGLR